ncbi:hypothetical protein GCM10022224_017070 [Nonomuraea antimicrobica]|uniref:Uncharacterized protein n=1 Tax=Nonomuraea antimicrobica TaxID=561173 RepID=A0ABP7BBW2_9ACTN
MAPDPPDMPLTCAYVEVSGWWPNLSPAYQCRPEAYLLDLGRSYGDSQAAASAWPAALHTALVRWAEDDGRTDLPHLIGRALAAGFGDTQAALAPQPLRGLRRGPLSGSVSAGN